MSKVDETDKLCEELKALIKVYGGEMFTGVSLSVLVQVHHLAELNRKEFLENCESSWDNVTEQMVKLKGSKDLIERILESMTS